MGTQNSSSSSRLLQMFHPSLASKEEIHGYTASQRVEEEGKE